MSREFKVANCWKERKIYVNFTNQKRRKKCKQLGEGGWKVQNRAVVTL